MSGASQFFRASVGAVLVGSGGRVLAFERADHPGVWQLPQGGLDEGEEPAGAVLREVREETGIEAAELDALGQHPHLLAYELPADLRNERTGRGQAQYWFYFRIRTEPRGVPSGEFRAFRWIDLRDLAAEVVEFRRSVYEQLLDHYEGAIRPRL